MVTTILRKMGPKVGLATFGLKQSAPEIYLAAGLVAMGTAVVMIAKAHKKAEDELVLPLTELDTIDSYIEGIESETGLPFDKTEERRQKSRAYYDIAKGCVQLYGPGILMGVGGVALILTSHGVMRGRTKALLSTAVMLERGFSTYRSRVVEEFGAEADERLFYGAEERTVVTLEPREDGKKPKKVKRKKNHLPETPAALLYSKVFDSSNVNWTHNDDAVNEFWLQQAEAALNAQYQWRGYVLLNDLYQQLGFERTSAGCVVGWHKNVAGDDFVDLGLHRDINNREGENRWVIDPNVNGPIWQSLDDN